MNWNEFRAKIQKISGSIIRNNRRLYDRIGGIASKEVIKRTRLGYGVSGRGKSKEKLAPLKDSYKKWRKKNRGKLHSETSPARSNLTKTGQMLDSISYDAKPNSMKLKLDNAEAKRKAEWAHGGSTHRKKRPFFNLSKQEVKKIRDFVKDYLVKEIKKVL